MDADNLNQLIKVYNSISTVTNDKVTEHRNDIIRNGRYPDTVLTGAHLKVMIDSLALLRYLIGTLVNNQEPVCLAPIKQNSLVDDTTIKFYQLVDDVVFPHRGSAHAAGYDLFVSPTFPVSQILPGKRLLVGTGIAWEPSTNNYYMRIAPRSGLSLKGIDIGGGVVDPDYRGEIGIIVINNGEGPFEIKPKQKIAQAIVTPFTAGTIVNQVKGIQLGQSERGANGFGSTGN